ncbi:hypothetical protein PWP93_35490 [Paraburkholderia sp. A1RI-2L]|uniref:hypothetical protein n=1 Tax=Paraburkholderia sp. A1RI-2L TaxID=3028367 RepID=UPI003B78503F
MPKYAYRVSPRTAELGGGYHLRLYVDGEEMGGGVYPADPDAAPADAVDWWNRLKEHERAVWLVKANSALAVDAWGEFLREKAHADALAEGWKWITRRGSV